MESGIPHYESLPSVSFHATVKNYTSLINRRNGLVDDILKSQRNVFFGHSSTFVNEICGLVSDFFLVKREDVAE